METVSKRLIYIDLRSKGKKDSRFHVVKNATFGVKDIKTILYCLNASFPLEL